MIKRRMGLWLGTVVLATTGLARTNYVDAAITGGGGTGASWANAYSQLWQAVSAAAVSDVVWVAQGVYAPTNADNRSATLLLAKTGVRVYGGFTNGMSSLAQRDWANYPALLSGEIQNDGLRTNNAIHVVTITNANVKNITLDGLVFTNSFGDGGLLYGSGQYGGITGIQVFNCTFVDNGGAAAVYDNNSFSPTFSNCLFRSNAQAIHDNSSSNPRLTACRFESNSGSAIRNDYSSSPVLSGCFFGTNTAPAGAAIYNFYNSSPTVQECQFVGNSATNGGAVYNEAAGSSCAPVFSNCVFAANVATGSVYGGGAVFSKSCAPTYLDCLFQANAATNQGGAVFNHTPVAPTATDTFIRCTFVANQGRNGGGAGYASYSRVLFRDCILAANAASNGMGGAITLYASGAAATLANCVLSGNGAGAGGAVYADSGGFVTATNCVFCGNQGTGAVAQIQVASGNRSVFKNTLFCGNVSPSYAGCLSLQWSQPFVTISNCTFAGNAAASVGGAIHMDNLQSSQDFSLVNSVMWDNAAPSGGSVLYVRNAYAMTTAVSLAFSDLAGGWNGATVVVTGPYAAFVAVTNRGGNLNADPLFAPVRMGTWTAPSSPNTVPGQTTLTDAGAGWTVNGLQGLLVQPNTNSALQYLVASNSATTVTLWGLATPGGLTPYAIRDYHPCSTGGRWTPGNTWVLDSVKSPCIDSGDPAAGYALEPQPNGSRINMGFDGNTAQASKAAPGATTLLFR